MIRANLTGVSGSVQTSTVQEHALVLKTLQPLDRRRRCFRQTGDVLVERTVEDVLPAVQMNKDQLDQVCICCAGPCCHFAMLDGRA